MSLDQPALVLTLEQANSSERDATQKLAENRLKEWETHPGFHQLLQTVYNDLSLPLQTRWLAIIKFKNGVDKFWRASRQGSMSPEEKAAIRQSLFELIDEPNRQLSIQNAHAISRICRYDFPTEWPTLFDDLERILQQSAAENNSVKTYNVLIILNLVIKNLAMAKIGRTRPALLSKAPIITPLLLKLYTSYFTEWAESIDFGAMEVGYLALKVLRRLICDVYDAPHQRQDLVEGMTQFVHHFELLVTNYEKYSGNDVLEKYIKCYAKIFYLLTKSNPTSFVLLPCSKEVLQTLLKLLHEKAPAVYNNNDEEDGSVWEFIAIKTLLILKSLVAFLFKKGAVLTLKNKSSKEEVNNAMTMLTTQFFSEELIKSLTDLLINYYIKLKPSDLESWTNEPEEWANDEVNQSYEFQIRQCAENFFQDLMQHFKDLLVPYVLNKVQNELMTNYNEVSVQNILMKDSVFSIFQLSAASITETVDFNDLCERIFFPEALKNDLSENRILKRRVSLLINECIQLEVITRENMVKVYDLLLQFLDPSNPINDKVVNLTAVQALKTCITDWDFKKEDFQPFIKEYTAHLLRLASEMELTESKLFLLTTIAELVERTTPLISGVELDQLLTVVPKFWDSSNDYSEMILKGNLLRILKNLVVALNSESPKTWEIALPLIRVSCSPKSEYQAVLCEDGYELWLTLLQCVPLGPVDPTALQTLVAYANEFFMDALLHHTEILPLVLEIWRSYALLIPELILRDESKELVLGVLGTMAKYLPQMRDDALDVLISYLDIVVIENYPEESNFQKLLSLGVQSELFPTMIKMVLDPDQSDQTISKLLLIMARVSYRSPAGVVQMLQYLFPDEHDVALRKFITVWYARMDGTIIGNLRNRKTHVLGLTALLQTGDERCFEDLKTLVSLWISSLEEVNESAQDGDCEAYHSNYLYEFKYLNDLTVLENGEYLRFQQLHKLVDPVHNVKMKEYIQTTVAGVEVAIGQQNWMQLVSQLDKNLVDNFQYFMGLPTNN